MVLEMAVDRGVSGGEVLYCTLTVSFCTSQLRQKSHLLPHLQK